MKKYAIINKRTKEFYPDPVYLNQEQAQEKIAYIESISQRHETFEIEELTPEREKEHDQALSEFLHYMD